MIEEPPLLTIRNKTPRPSAEQIEALRDTPTGFLVDALQGRGALDHRIKPIRSVRLGNNLCGPALTCLCGPADLLAILGGLAEVKPGDVMVAATGFWRQSAVIGDRVMGMLRNAGAVGFVTDGLVRDTDGIATVGLPVFCSGVSPNSPFSKGPGEIGFPVSLGDVVIDTGDLIVGDSDGVVVVPYARIDEVINTVKQIRKLEHELDAEVENGLVVPEAIRDLLNSDQVKRV